MKFLVFIACFLQFLGAIASEQDGMHENQGADFNGTLVDEQHTPIPFATVRLLRADSSFIKAAISNLSGDFLIHAELPPGDYFLAFSSLEYQREMVSVSLSSDGMFMISTIVLHRLAKELAEAVVLGQKRYLEQQGNKMLVNVDANQSSANSNALELLQSTPGVIFNRQSGNLVVNGRAGVSVQFNGRTVRYSGEQLAEMLANVAGSSISKIEIISTPSATADASGAGGIVNIILKKPVADGTNGEYMLAAGIGQYARGKSSLLINHHKKNYNLFSDISVQYDKYAYTEQGTRRVEYLGTKTYFNNALNRSRINTPLTLRLGGDFTIDTSNTVSAMVLLNTIKTQFNNISTNEINDEVSGTKSTIDQDAQLLKTGYDLLSNVNYEHRFSELHSSMQVNIDWFVSAYKRQNNYRGQEIANNERWLYYNPIENKLNVFTLQMDYQQPLSQKTVVSVGLKNTSTNRTDDSKFEIKESQNTDDMLPFNQRYQFAETIQAFYAQIETKWNPRWQYTAGLRSEYLRRSAQVNTDSINRQTNEVQLFPSGSISFAPKEGWQYSLSYSRRITRPSYRNLSPVRTYTDPFSSLYGNPNLKPQIDNVMSLSATVLKYLTITPSFTLSENTFANLLYQDDSSKAVSSVMSNMNRQYTYSVLSAISMPLTKWWNITTSFNCGIDKIQMQYIGQSFNKSLTWNMVQAQSQWILPQNWSIQCDVWRVSSVDQGFLKQQAYGNCTISIKKTIESTSIILQGNDVFHTFIEKKSADFFNYHYTSSGLSDTRQIWLTIKHRFGNKKVEKSKKRSYDVGEIKQRAGE